MIKFSGGQSEEGGIPLEAVYGSFLGTILIAFSTGHEATHIAQPVQSSSIILGTLL